MHSYFAFGLKIRSTLEFPELVRHEFEESDVTIETRSLALEPEITLRYEMSLERYWLNMPNLGEMVVEEGRRIIIQQCYEKDESLDHYLRLFILGSGFGNLLFQRGIIPMHGSVVVKAEKAYLFLGDSGNGKSTLAMYLTKYKGCQIICDDIAAIDFDAEGHPVVWAAYPQTKLNPDSLEELAMAYEQLPRVIQDQAKRKTPLPHHKYLQPFRLKKTLLLSGDQNSSIVEPITGVEKFDQLRRYLFRKEYNDYLTANPINFKKFNQLVRHQNVCWLHRPINIGLAKSLPLMFQNIF